MRVLSHFVQNLALSPRSIAQLIKLIALLFSACVLSVTPARAQLASVPSSGIELTKLEVLHNVPVGLTLAQVQSGQAGAFVTQNDLRVFHGQWHRAFWLRLHFKRLTEQPNFLKSAVIALPIPFLDSVSVYTPGNQPDAPWSVQIGGDFFKPSESALRGLYPKFNVALPGQSAWQGGEQMVLYVQLDHLAPIKLNVEIADAAKIQDRDLLALALYCMGFGAVLLVAMITAAMAWLHRDSIYAWYSAYAVCAALSCAAHAGVAHHVLWPVGGYWPGTAVLFFILLSCVCLMKFSMALNSEHIERLGWRSIIHVFCAACVLIAVGYTIFTDYWREFYFTTFGVILVTMGLAVVMMVIGARSGSKLAWAWLLAFIPLFITILLSVAQGVGLLQPSQWSYSTVIYAATLEVLTLGLALQWFARERHGQKSRMKTLADVDPLTGFVSKEAFQTQLVRDWYSQATRKLDLAIVYIELRTQAASKKQMEDLLKRSVRILRSATTANDVVSRLDGTLMAISMPHVQMGDDLSQRLSRIIALGLMPDRSDMQAIVLQFRIAATTRQHFNAPFAQLDAQLRDLLAQDAGWGSKPIRFVDGISRKAAPRPLSTMPDLDDVWEKAFQQEQKDKGAVAKP